MLSKNRSYFCSYIIIKNKKHCGNGDLNFTSDKRNLNDLIAEIRGRLISECKSKHGDVSIVFTSFNSVDI